MEETKNNKLKEFFKNIGLAFQKLVADDEVNDVELTGELAKDPLESFRLSQEPLDKSTKSTSKSKTRTNSKAPTSRSTSQTKNSHSRTRKQKSNIEIDHDEL